MRFLSLIFGLAMLLGGFVTHNGSLAVVGGGFALGGCACCACGGCKATPANECAACLGFSPPALTPSNIHLTYKGGTAASSKCSFEIAGNLYVYKMTITPGSSMLLNQDAVEKCVWKKVINGAGLISIKRCVGDGSGCAACVPTTEIVTRVTITCTQSGCRDPFAVVETSDPDVGTVTVAFYFFDATSCSGCCGVDDRTGGAADGGESWLDLVGGGYVVSPC